ncbi:MAG: hypothetical protein ACYDHD_05910 [Vulcanimicrobiaceae bacterium]
MLRPSRILAATLVCALLCALPANAERPIVDFHKLDSNFMLFARDSNVPWQPTTVRLDTYTNAPVQFAAYQVNPGDVLTAGTNARPRVIVTAGRRPVATWSYTPPGGFQFQSSEVTVPLGNRQGFFVVEARRGNVGEQVWINRTRVALLAKQTPHDILLYATDLGSGRALSHMRVQFVVNGRFVTRYTHDDGVLRWTGMPRPVFALAQWGDSYAFVSFLPQAPLPRTLLGIRLDSASLHAGGVVQVVGFARRQVGSAFRPAGDVGGEVELRYGARLIAHDAVRLNPSGAFATSLKIPANAPAGDYAVLAQAAGGVAGASLHIDADANGLSLSVASACVRECNPDANVPVTVRARRYGRPVGGVPVTVAVVRSPHILFGGPGDDDAWGTTRWYKTTVRTGGDGQATFDIPRPTDGLASTYGVRASAGGATADTRIVVPTAPIALRLRLDHDRTTLGVPVGFQVVGRYVATDAPARNVTVTVQLAHDPSVQQQTVTLDAQGWAHGVFRRASLGTSIVLAKAVFNGAEASDAAQVSVVPRADDVQRTDASDAVHIGLGRSVYRAGEDMGVQVTSPGARGDAFLSVDSAISTDTRVVPTHDGRASTMFRVLDAPGQLDVGAAVVRDGALAWNVVPLPEDAPGRAVPMRITIGGGNTPGAVALVRVLQPLATHGTLVVRLSRGIPSGSALFETAPQLLAVRLTTTQTSAPPGVTWHPWVDSTGAHPQVIVFIRPTAPRPKATLAKANSSALYWKVERPASDLIRVPLPRRAGAYTLSLLEIADNGRLAAGSARIVVR